MSLLRVLITTVAAISALASVGAPDAAVGSKSSKCTISGTPKRDVLRGTRKADVICGRGGADRIHGGGGRDVLVGGAGQDVVNAGSGDDKLRGKHGADNLYGEVGNDRLTGGPQADLLDGGEGDDRCDESDPADRLDTTCSHPFRIRNLTVTPSAIDTSAAERVVKVEMEIEHVDPATGPLTAVAFDVADPVADQPSGSYPLRGKNAMTLVSGDRLAGTWRGMFSLRRWSPKGRYGISVALFVGSGTGYIYLEPEDLAQAGLANGFDQLGFGDSGPPQPQSISLTPRSFDTSTGPVDVQLEVRITDDLFGVQDNSVFADMFSVGFLYMHASYTLIRTSGTPLDGIWASTLRFPRHSPTGQYQLGRLYVSDGFNAWRYDSPELAARGLDGTVSQVGPGDAAAPQLVDLALGSSPGTAEVHVRATDDLSGVSRISGRLAGMGHEYPFVVYDPSGGTPTDATFDADVQVPPGSYELVQLIVTDEVERYSLYEKADLEALGFPTQVTVP